jgi:hypothetical protein
VISTVGFPIVAFYLLYRLIRNELKQLSDSVNKHATAIEKQTAIIEAEYNKEVENAE